MSPHYLVKRKVALFAVYNSYYYNINVLLHRYIIKYISISPLSAVCLVCNVHVTEVISLPQ